MKIFIFVILLMTTIDFGIRLAVAAKTIEKYETKIENNSKNNIGMILNLLIILWGAILILR